MNTCPDCASPLIPIVYGYPSPATFQLADEGILRLGGCVITGLDMANSACTVCDWVGRLDA